MTDPKRRHVLRGIGATLTIGTIAGCTGDDGGNGNGDDGEWVDDVPQAIDDHLSDARGYDGQILDATDADEVTVDVGAGGDGLSFDPAAIRVSSGTTVVWEWTGQGGTHNVASTDDSAAEFQSEYMDGEGETFEETFDEAGTQLYVCQPHEAQGMKGGVEVVD